MKSPHFILYFEIIGNTFWEYIFFCDVKKSTQHPHPIKTKQSRLKVVQLGHLHTDVSRGSAS